MRIFYHLSVHTALKYIDNYVCILCNWCHSFDIISVFVGKVNVLSLDQHYVRRVHNNMNMYELQFPKFTVHLCSTGGYFWKVSLQFAWYLLLSFVFLSKNIKDIGPSTWFCQRLVHGAKDLTISHKKCLYMRSLEHTGV